MNTALKKRRCGPRYNFCPLNRQHWRRLCSLVLLLSLSSKILSISMTSNALLCRNLFNLFVLLFSNTWHLQCSCCHGNSELCRSHI
ncbi:hypothetical protein BD769DRAFT_1056330 [Suillus cothurnatus]|nr:hypothetical protein BD769DRAFT_1056330 [Suillus cothurnatus]